MDGFSLYCFHKQIKIGNSLWSVKESRSLTEAEIDSISSITVVESQYGKSACITFKCGGVSYIPLTENSNVDIDESFDIAKAKLLTLSKSGKSDIFRLEVILDNEPISQQIQNNIDDWIIKEERYFEESEIADVKYAVVVLTPSRVSVCILMKNGGRTHIPLAPGSSVGVGELVDLSKAKVQVLTKPGESDIYRIFI